uniref:Minor capsid protein n=1 Tax=Micrococcus phage Kurnik TaxID=3092208 RepID=A0AAU6R651_9CAUD
MAGSKFTFEWDEGQLSKNIETLPEKINDFIEATVQYYAVFGEAVMKKNARWRDRSTNARNSLHTQPIRQGNHHELVFAHGMAYGIWLEVRWGGKYAIIMPTINHVRPLIMKTLNKGMSRIKGSA